MKKSYNTCLVASLVLFLSLCVTISVLSLMNINRIAVSQQGVVIDLKDLSIFRTLQTAIAPSATITTTLFPTSIITPTVPSPSPQVLLSAPSNPMETIQILENTIVPGRDNSELAWRFKGISHLSLPNNNPAKIYRVGDIQSFFASNDDNDENFQVDATLRNITPHLYFWIQNGTPFDQDELKLLCQEFENSIYTRDRKILGSEWTPGIDNDVHLYVLYVSDIGNYVAGYFSSVDETPPELDPYSNAHEMFYINTTESLGTGYIFGVMAHEFQHMIHWYQDTNEVEWINEGLADLTVRLNGFDPGGFDYSYSLNPDIPMTNWPESFSDTDPYYGSAYLFFQYFYERFGEDTIHKLVSEPANGMDGIDQTLKDMTQYDSMRSKLFSGDDVFVDWTIANYLHLNDLADGRYGYSSYPQAPKTYPTETIDNCPTEDLTRSVNQYGVDYIEVRCQGNYSIQFNGNRTDQLVSTTAHSGSHFFWSNSANDSDSKLTHHFDFRQVKGPISMTYWTWYDLEENFDFVYVLLSEDGNKWHVLTPQNCIQSDNGFGCGLTGNSSGWVQQTLNLTEYAGKEIDLQFEYLTDSGVLKEGFLLDDVSIPAIGYSTDFEKDDGDWIPSGFARIENTLPQTYRVTLITQGSKTKVEEINVDENGHATIPVMINDSVNSIVLVISGTARITQIEADYSIQILVQ